MALPLGSVRAVLIAGGAAGCAASGIALLALWLAMGFPHRAVLATRRVRMFRERFRWRLATVCAFLVWVAIIVAGVIASLLPEPWRWLPAVLPAGVVVLIGVAAAHHWWTRGAFLIAAPLLVVGGYNLVEALRSTEGTRYHSYAVGFAIAGLGYGLALAAVAMMLAGLGVIIGQRRQGTARDAADLVADAAHVVDDAWALAEGTPADGTGPLPFGPVNLPEGRPYTRGPDGHQAADPTYRRP